MKRGWARITTASSESLNSTRLPSRAGPPKSALRGRGQPVMLELVGHEAAYCAVLTKERTGARSERPLSRRPQAS